MFLNSSKFTNPGCSLSASFNVDSIIYQIENINEMLIWNFPKTSLTSSLETTKLCSLIIYLLWLFKESGQDWSHPTISLQNLKVASTNSPNSSSPKITSYIIYMKLIEILFSNLSSLLSFFYSSNQSSHHYSHHKSGRKLIYRETTNRSKGSKNRLKYIHLSHFLSKFKEQCSFSSEVAWLDNKLKHDTNSPKSTNPSESASNVENMLYLVLIRSHWFINISSNRSSRKESVNWTASWNPLKCLGHLYTYTHLFLTFYRSLNHGTKLRRMHSSLRQMGRKQLWWNIAIKLWSLR